MRVQLEDLESDLNANGWTELFSQSDKCAPYVRQRPEGQTYISLNAGYQKIIRQLVDVVPDDSGQNPEDELMKFITR